MSTAAKPPSRSRRRRIPRPALVGAAVAVLAAAAVGGWALRPKGDATPYRTAAVERGDVTRSVSASGALQARVTVQVGSQLSGQIKEVFVDFNTPVKKGQILAVVDPSTYQSRATQAQADVNAQEAALQQQQANLRQAEAEMVLQKANYERSKTLGDKGWLAQSALDQAEATYKKAVAAVGTAQAQINSQQARINQSRASFAATEFDVGRTRIVSPIDGVVVSRAVDPGQTVAASLQVSTLFQIAQDLSKLQVKVLVDEADIGQVREGQQVEFTVDAYPDETFTGVVTQVRKQPESEQNVVAYPVIAEADNRGGRLLPGMTANVNIVIAQERNVLKVPSAALRWSPPGQAADTPRQGAAFGGPGFGPGGPPGQRQAGQGRGAGAGDFAQRADERLYEALKLDAGQKAKAEPILAAAREKARAAQGDDPQARRGAMQAAMSQAYDQLAPILNTEQKAALAAFRARQQAFAGGRRGGAGLQRGTVWVVQDGQPSPISVQVGASDGSFTQVQGPLQPGQAVITGGGPKAPAQLRGGGPGVIPGGGPPPGQFRRIG